jgi:uncharacterized protein YbjQ (UPF0145 family)
MPYRTVGCAGRVEFSRGFWQSVWQRLRCATKNYLVENNCDMQIALHRCLYNKWTVLAIQQTTGVLKSMLGGNDLERDKMADCVKCGKKLGFLNTDASLSYGGMCIKCSKLDREAKSSLEAQGIQKEEEHRKIQIESVLLTTDYGHDLKILKRVEIVTAECAFGMNIFKDLFAGVRDIVGGRSEAVQNTMRDARKTALFELKREAHLVGANAVIGGVS